MKEMSLRVRRVSTIVLVTHFSALGAVVWLVLGVVDPSDQAVPWLVGWVNLAATNLALNRTMLVVTHVAIIVVIRLTIFQPRRGRMLLGAFIGIILLGGGWMSLVFFGALPLLEGAVFAGQWRKRQLVEKPALPSINSRKGIVEVAIQSISLGAGVALVVGTLTFNYLAANLFGLASGILMALSAYSIAELQRASTNQIRQ